VSAAAAPRPAGSQAADEWAQIGGRAPKMADTLRRYLTQAATFLAPNSVEVAERTLRQLAGWLLDHTDVRTVADVRRNHIEDFKLWLAAQPGMRGDGLAQNTQRQRLRMLRVFFERIIEWDWPDAPTRNPIIGRDIPPRPEPLPKFLDDRDAARLMAAARSARDPRDRLVVEVLARTGLRAGELCDLDADAVVLIGDGHWLRVPIGKLRNDRYVPSNPTSSPWSPTGPRSTSTTSGTTVASSPITAALSTDTSSVASCVASPATPASAPTPTSSATRWPPRRSIGACGSKPSQPSWATGRWR
jgi:integrase